ncbi:regulatory iron-sulfur-containing complex subunit RicT [Prolixibacteraceae bacterium]|nr:regulatory iron-sulfur-containing complex subunit RicT [Prolixibacteraceae bacterium]
MNSTDNSCKGCSMGKESRACPKLQVHDWLSDVPNTFNRGEIVEVRFKNTRKDYYFNVHGIHLEIGDMVAVEASPGHDIGMVSLTGDLVLKQIQRHKVTYIDGELRKVYRVAKPVDIEKWEEAMSLEHQTMLKARNIAEELQLNMKIGDVEFQGDKTKAIFYYIADERVDFRQLIKVYAETFRIRIEMKQIGARQEAGRIGGIGPCGRELCCSSWMTNFVSVTTNAARYQEISLNPQKLAGQCGKLKCCLNYELDCYMDAQKDFPSTQIPLHTRKGKYLFQKADIFNRVLWYALDGSGPNRIVALTVDKVKEIIKKNRNSESVDELISDVDASMVISESTGYQNVVGQDSLDRFDKLEDKPIRRKKKGRNPRNDKKQPPRNLKNNRGDNETPHSIKQENKNIKEEERNHRNRSNIKNKQRPNDSKGPNKPEGMHKQHVKETPNATTKGGGENKKRPIQKKKKNFRRPKKDDA